VNENTENKLNVWLPECNTRE